MGFCRTTLFLHLLLFPAIRANSFLTSSGFSQRNPIQNVLDHEPAKNVDCSNSNPTGPIDTTLCDFETVESVNDELFSNLHELVATPFFKFFQVDLYRECPFWSDEGFCDNPSCGITSVDESEIPERWRAKSLSKLEGSKIDDRHELPGCYYRDSDFCFLDDNTGGDYYDLTLIPERYTGYAGPDTRRIWRSIYEENCFGLSEVSLHSGPNPALVSLPDRMTDAFRNEDGDGGQCLEKRVYYKVISGLHASISTHICQEYLNQTTGEWYPNLQCFINRVASHPERLQYIYFNTVLLLRAIARIGPYLQAFDYCSTGGHEDDAETLAKLGNVISIAQRAGRFDETVLFRGENANVLKEEFKDHFRNVTRIMDCVGCDKCRLWGKIQTTGVATALKILFELDEKALDPAANHNLLQRSEVVALMNTLHRFSESLAAVDNFRRMWKATSAEEGEQLIVEAERVAKETSRPRPSARVGKDFDSPEMLLTRWLRVCKQSTVDCVGMFVQIWFRAVNAVASVFTPSGKERGPSGFEL
ncbi:Endoplasmic oxidoreductin-1 [Mycena indigotica]|uniref:Endoplasmic oxidoreductin-1 n=1 Tax=Mycena indigotica TaxID=2126181 RepID=A0A8H6TBH3_9AGAR|nr:Endoplasmic oxidoreductin-1 [Mycena indigotica]KAF7315463.1 Endoplasmic oxidoreductin-1 [Mycena indigotica]